MTTLLLSCIGTTRAFSLMATATSVLQFYTKACTNWPNSYLPACVVEVNMNEPELYDILDMQSLNIKKGQKQCSFHR